MLGDFEFNAFEYGSGTDVHGSCGFLLKDEFFIAGGLYSKRQVYFLSISAFL